MKLALLAQLLCLLEIAKGLQCWTCQEMQSADECAIRGKLETCIGDSQMCETVARRDGKEYRVTKGCKHEIACHNNMMQNTRVSGTSTHCNSEQPNSLCTCCCNGTACNANVFSCLDIEMHDTKNTSCPQQTPNVPHGSVTCFNGEDTGTFCQLQCTHPYEPTGQDKLICLTNGSWNKPKPCCKLPCPPYYHYDSAAVYHVSNNRTFQVVSTLFSQTVSHIATGEDATLFAGIYYSGTPRLSTRFLFNQYEENATRLITLLRDRFIPVNTEDGLVNTGAALNYALDTFYLERNGARPNVPKILIIVTDSNSDDSIAGAAHRAKERGYITYVLLIKSKDKQLDLEEFRNFVSDPNYLFQLDLQQPNYEEYFSDAHRYFCTNTCST